MNRGPLTVLVLVALFVGFGSGLRAAPYLPAAEPLPFVRTDARLDQHLLNEVLDDIDGNFYFRDRVTSENLSEGAAAGIVESLDDPHSVYLPQEASDSFQNSIQGELEGIGAELSEDGGVILVVAVLKDTPAQKAGIVAGDAIVRIDDETTADMSVSDAVRRIRGPKGTTVRLFILHEGSDEAEEIIVARDRIHIESVTWKMEGDKLAVVSISQFTEGTADELSRGAQELLAKGVRGIVLDLRYNPGGILEQAVRVSSFFLGDGVIVRQKGRNDGRTYEIRNGNVIVRDGERETITAPAQPFLKEIPVVVLVNGSSASAAEIVAGAFADYARGALVGERTYGKGTVQELVSVTGGASVKLTIAEWLTPKGRSIDREGLTPDQEVKMTPEDVRAKRDPQLDAAKARLQATLRGEDLQK